MASDLPLIRLWRLNGIGVIVDHPTGVLYSNQTGGYACFHPSTEGAFVLLTDPDIDQQTRLERYFTGPKWEGYCDAWIDEETADFVDQVLAASTATARLRVDRTRLEDSHEAWIHVTIVPATDDGYLLFGGFPGRTGILTWANSD